MSGCNKPYYWCAGFDQPGRGGRGSRDRAYKRHAVGQYTGSYRYRYRLGFNTVFRGNRFGRASRLDVLNSSYGEDYYMDFRYSLGPLITTYSAVSQPYGYGYGHNFLRWKKTTSGFDSQWEYAVDQWSNLYDAETHPSAVQFQEVEEDYDLLVWNMNDEDLKWDGLYTHYPVVSSIQLNDFWLDKYLLWYFPNGNKWIKKTPLGMRCNLGFHDSNLSKLILYIRSENESTLIGVDSGDNQEIPEHEDFKNRVLEYFSDK